MGQPLAVDGSVTRRQNVVNHQSTHGRQRRKNASLPDRLQLHNLVFSQSVSATHKEQRVTDLQFFRVYYFCPIFSTTTQNEQVGGGDS